MSKNTHFNNRQNHPEATQFLNELVLDLRKKEDGLPYQEITIERLQKATKYIIELSRCFQCN